MNDHPANPYNPPGKRVLSTEGKPLRYRVINSKTSIREFQGLANSRIRGSLCWVAAKVGLLNFDQQIIDAPKPFLEDLCDFTVIPERLAGEITRIEDEARPLGFHDSVYSVHESTGVQVLGAAVRMLHRSGSFFLQHVVATHEQLVQGETHLISIRDKSVGPFTSYATSSGRPTYRRAKSLHARYVRDGHLSDRLMAHRAWIGEGLQPLTAIHSINEIASVLDQLELLHRQNMLDRGIWVEHQE